MNVFNINFEMVNGDDERSRRGQSCVQLYQALHSKLQTVRVDR